MIISNKHSGYSKDGIRLYPIDSGGGGGPTTSTTNTSNIPEYARPYVETMLGAAQNELFNYETQKPTNPFAEFSGSDGLMGKVAADFDAQNPGVKTPTGLKGYQAFGGTYDASGKQTGYDVDKYFGGFQPLQQQAFAAAKTLGPTQQNMDASNLAAQAGARAMGTQYQGGQFGNTYQGLQNYDPGQYNQQSVNAPNLQNYQMGSAERVGAQNFSGQSAQDYMNPYMQNVVDTQQAAAQRQADIESTQRGANAARSGAFGGSRQAVMDAEAARALASQKGSIQATGLQGAYSQAQAQFNADQARQQAAQQSNQGAGLTVGQQNLAANLGIQSLGAGQSLAAQQANQQTNLATQQAQQTANQFGYGQQANQAQNMAQYGQAANALNANQQQFGANLGLQGVQAANQAASTLGTLGQQQFGQQLSSMDAQNRMGTQQQQFEQGKIDQQIKDYANKQQFSMQQLANMSSLLRGLPMQSTTTQTYQAAPSGVSQIAGLGTTAAAAYGLSGAGKAKGGVIKKTKKSGLDHLGMYNATK